MLYLVCPINIEVLGTDAPCPTHQQQLREKLRTHRPERSLRAIVLCGMSVFQSLWQA